MSSREAPKRAVQSSAPRGPRLCAIAFVGLTAIVAAGCSAEQGGFHPLYATSDGKTFDDRLASVQISTIPGRVGQRIRNELVFQRSTGGDPVDPQRRLDITITETVLTTLVDTTGASSSQVYQLEARYQLIDLKTKAKLFESRSLGRGSFDRFASIYSNIRARQDAEDRVAKSIAEDIRTRVVTFLSRPS